MSSLWGGNKIKPPVEKCYSTPQNYPNVFGGPDSPDSTRTRGTRITRLSDRSDHGSYSGSHRQSTDRLTPQDHQSYIFHTANQRINSIYDESDRASSCNTKVSHTSGTSGRSQYSTNSTKSLNSGSGGSNTKILKTIKSDVKEAAYEGCLMDGPLGPAITEKDRRQRKFLILGFVCAAFVAILCLALKEVGYNNGLTKLIESKAKEEVQLEQLQEAMFQNNMNKIEKILRANSGLEVVTDFEESQSKSDDDDTGIFTNLFGPFFGSGSASNRDVSTNLGPNLGPTEQNIDHNNYPVPQTDQGIDEEHDQIENSEVITMPQAAPLMAKAPRAFGNAPDLTNKVYDPKELLEFLKTSGLSKSFVLQDTEKPKIPNNELEQKIDGSMNEITTMLDSFLNELYILIEDFLNDSQNIIDTENPDLAALFLAKQEKQIINLMKGEEQHLSKRLDNISEKSLNRAGKVRGKISKEDQLKNPNSSSLKDHISDLLNKKIDLMQRDKKKKIVEDNKNMKKSDLQQKNYAGDADLYTDIKQKLRALADETK